MKNNKLTTSEIDRNNILNNPYAIDPLQKGLGLDFPIIEGEMRMTLKQVASFFEVDARTIERYLEKYSKELKENGYSVFTGKRLSEAKKKFGSDIDVGTKTTVLGFFNFRSFLNLGMLLVESEKAKELRKIILDVVIDVMNKKTGGKTKYINQRDDVFLRTYADSVSYRKEFTNALHKYVNAGAFKFPLMTNKIYHFLFGEHVDEYRLLLKLNPKDNVRHTFYHEVLTVVSAIENGFADRLKKEFENRSSKVSYNETEDLFDEFIRSPVLVPVVNKARTIMASRDNCLREIIHKALQPYIESLSPEEHQQFLSDDSIETGKKTKKAIELIERKTKEAIELIEKNKEVFIRLKDR